MDLEEYCHDINDMNVGRLIEQFQRLEENAEKLKPIIRQRVDQSRKALDEQYELVFKSSENLVERTKGIQRAVGLPGQFRELFSAISMKMFERH